MIKPPIFTLSDGLKVQFLYFLAPPQRNLYIRLNSGPLTFSLYFLYIIPCISGLRNIGFPRDNKWFSVISELIFLERVRFLLILAHNQSGGGAGQSRDQRRGGGGGPAEPYYGFGFAPYSRVNHIWLSFCNKTNTLFQRLFAAEKNDIVTIFRYSETERTMSNLRQFQSGNPSTLRFPL